VFPLTNLNDSFFETGINDIISDFHFYFLCIITFLSRKFVFIRRSKKLIVSILFLTRPLFGDKIAEAGKIRGFIRVFFSPFGNSFGL
jgi:hypothetical protein